MLRDIVQTAIGSRLAARPATMAECSLWEKRTWNLHRGVALVHSSFATADEVEDTIRKLIVAEFDLRWAWLRGFAYGAVVHAPALPDGAEKLADAIDTRSRKIGVLQWIVFVCDQPRIAFGAHTWSEGYLSPVFRAIAGGLREAGIRCETVVSGKGKLFEFAQMFLDVPEFEDRDSGR